MVVAKGEAAIPVIVVTIFWFGFAAVTPWFVKGPNKSTIRTMIALTAVCCWLFWLIAYMSQLNPIIGPTLKNETYNAIKNQW
ncbi:V-type proton ATPase subunit e 2-like [Xenia sp. Carnegie-2017]|uniref:V-type proton ATPase subunit e 2-like n=1 Tax=Xenia sp. Carnegie-2017 TaxID=2897299 RepID=UPI001F0424DC|nr:V-type proton ATPase subunit e 2-like [Xenia sp. Carnegie-2017]